MKRTLYAIRRKIFRTVSVMVLSNVIIILVIAALFYSKPNDNVIDNFTSGLSIQSNKIELNKTASNIIDNYETWAALIDYETNSISWQVNKPSDIPDKLETDLNFIQEQTSLNKHPILSRKIDDKLLVLGFSPEKYVIYKDYLVDLKLISIIPFYLVFLLIINLALVIDLFHKLIRGLSKDIEAVSDMIAQIPSPKTEETTEVIEPLNVLVSAVNESRKSIQEQSQFQKDWLSGISHDLKTPLANIIGYASLLKMKPDSSKAKKYADKINLEALYIQDVIDNLLITNQLELDEEISKEKVDIIDLIKKVILEQANSYTSKEHTITFVNDTNLDEFILKLNSKLVVRAFKNLLGNSIKHNPNGCDIVVRLFIEGENFYISIKDNGVGVSKSELENIENTKYQMIKADYHDGSRRTGMGIKIAANLLKHSDMELNFSSNKGEFFEAVVSVRL